MVLLGMEQAAGFLAAAVLITLSPGPDNLMVLSLGVARGRKQGMVFGLGCALGCLSHTVLAALGISALLAASPAAFMALRIAGGLYLLWLGWQAWRHSGSALAQRPDDTPQESSSRLFAKGLLANAINPKVVLFFLAFLPQFVVSQQGHIAWQTAQLGLLFTLQAALVFGLLGYFAGYAGSWLASSRQRSVYLDRLAGSIFALLGLKLLLTR
jgi:threonine/homoserine/homoserine lactone efflux protein